MTPTDKLAPTKTGREPLTDACVIAGYTITKVLIDERACRCGKRFCLVLAKGRRAPVLLHTEPRCEQSRTMTGPQYLAWATGSPDKPPPRKERRAEAKRRRARRAR